MLISKFIVSDNASKTTNVCLDFTNEPDEIPGEKSSHQINMRMIKESIIDKLVFEEGYWLDDNSIQTYLNSIKTNNDTIIVDMLLMKKLIIEKDGVNTYDFNSAKDWYHRKSSMLSNYNHIYVPINHNNNHWVFIYVNMIDRTVRYFDSLFDPKANNSVGELYNYYIKRFITDYGKQIGGGLKFYGDSYRSYIERYNETPQKNSYDCGTFMMLGIERHINKNYLPISQSEIKKERARICKSLLSPYPSLIKLYDDMKKRSPEGSRKRKYDTPSTDSVYITDVQFPLSEMNNCLLDLVSKSSIVLQYMEHFYNKDVLVAKGYSSYEELSLQYFIPEQLILSYVKAIRRKTILPSDNIHPDEVTSVLTNYDSLIQKIHRMLSYKIIGYGIYCLSFRSYDRMRAAFKFGNLRENINKFVHYLYSGDEQYLKIIFIISQNKRARIDDHYTTPTKDDQNIPNAKDKEILDAAGPTIEEEIVNGDEPSIDKEVNVSCCDVMCCAVLCCAVLCCALMRII